MEHQYPLNFDALRKGDVLDHDQLNEILGGVVIDAAVGKAASVRLAALKLAQLVMKRRPDLVCRLLCQNQEEGRYKLVILTDAEAATYTHRKFHLGLDKSARSLREQAAVDRNRLNGDQQKSHEHCLQMNAQISRVAFQAARRYGSLDVARRIQAQIGVVQREAPGVAILTRPQREHRLLKPPDSQTT
jgi:hypothetical protein